MGILINKNSKVLVQGFTGNEGTFHSEKMILYGTNIVGGVTPGKGGQTHLGKPVFNTMIEAVKKTNATVSVIFVPAIFAVDAILEAADSGIFLIVCITEGIPISDMNKVNRYLKYFYKNCKLIGPNCPGIITPNESKVGIMPGDIFKKGKIGIISKSGTLTYEAADQIVKSGYGISTAIGIGGDPIIGMSIKDITELFMQDDETDIIVIIGEIGGTLEIEAAKWIKKLGNKKLVFGFIAGQTAPIGRTMGHAGAIIGNEKETAQSKMRVMKDCGIHIINSPANIGNIVHDIIN